MDVSVLRLRSALCMAGDKTTWFAWVFEKVVRAFGVVIEPWIRLLESGTAG